LYDNKQSLIYISVIALKYIKEEEPMAYVITDKCKNCGACAEQCPVSAISAGNGKYEICPDTCIECNACAAQCPTDGAIEG